MPKAVPVPEDGRSSDADRDQIWTALFPAAKQGLETNAAPKKTEGVAPDAVRLFEKKRMQPVFVMPKAEAVHIGSVLVSALSGQPYKVVNTNLNFSANKEPEIPKKASKLFHFFGKLLVRHEKANLTF